MLKRLGVLIYHSDESLVLPQNWRYTPEALTLTAKHGN